MKKFFRFSALALFSVVATVGTLSTSEAAKMSAKNAGRVETETTQHFCTK